MFVEMRVFLALYIDEITPNKNTSFDVLQLQTRSY